MNAKDARDDEQDAEVERRAGRTTRACPACGNMSFYVKQYPADTASVYCADCGNRVLLVDLREANADSRWYDE